MAYCPAVASFRQRNTGCTHDVTDQSLYLNFGQLAAAPGTFSPRHPHSSHPPWRSGKPSPAQLRRLAPKPLVGDYENNLTSPATALLGSAGFLRLATAHLSARCGCGRAVLMVLRLEKSAVPGINNMERGCRRMTNGTQPGRYIQGRRAGHPPDGNE